MRDGRPSEFDGLSGAIVRLGRAKGVPTPTHAFAVAMLTPVERKLRGQLEYDF